MINEKNWTPLILFIVGKRKQKIMAEFVQCDRQANCLEAAGVISRIYQKKIKNVFDADSV